MIDSPSTAEIPMTPLEIPIATIPVRILMGFACIFVAVVVLGWVAPRFMIYVRSLPKIKWTVALAGGIVYAVMFGFALIPAIMFVELVQNPKTVISDEGLTRDPSLIHGSTRISWNEITRVTCLISRSGRVTSLSIHAVDGKVITVGNSGTAVLGPVYELLERRLGKGVVETCWIPFRNEPGVRNLSWLGSNRLNFYP